MKWRHLVLTKKFACTSPNNYGICSNDDTVILLGLVVNKI